MPKEGDTLAVRKIKEGMKKGKPKAPTCTTPEVVNGTVQEVVNEGSHTQPHTQPNEVVENSKNTVLGQSKGNSLKEDLNKEKSIWTVLSNLEVEQLKSEGLSERDITDGLDILTAAYKAEGLTPKSSQLVTGLLQMHRDAR